jgi:hypothetical protein
VKPTRPATGPARYIGRVGGLAAALGIGAAVISGAGAAWASPTSNSSTVHGGPSSSESPAKTKKTTPPKPSASRAYQHFSTTPAVAAPRNPLAAVASAIKTLLGPLAHPRAATTSPAPPADSPPVWTLLAAVRRDVFGQQPAPVTPIANSPLGDGIALIMGTSGNPAPPQAYLDAIDAAYLAPRGFAGTTQLLVTPEALYPFTGVASLPFNTSEAQDEQILDKAILGAIAGGKVNAANPVVVFGWSQSADVAGMVMPELAAQGVPAGDVHFVLVGDANNPNGGLLTRFSVDGLSPTVPSLGLPFGSATPASLYPTDIYTNEYDGAADFPSYPINLLSDLNAGLGIVFNHTVYPALAPQQIQNAVELPVSGTDTSTNYYMIPANLPLLDPLRFLPVIGNPLADLLQPATSVLVNLGYGSTTHGWDQRPADLPTALGLFPTNLGSVLRAVINAAPQGITAAIHDLQDPTTYQVVPAILDNPLTNQLIEVAHALGYTDATSLSQMLGHPADLLAVAQNALAGFAGFPISHASLLSSPTDLLKDLSGTLAYDFSTLIPVADAADAALTSLPAYDAELLATELASGDLLDAGGLPIAADAALIPAALVFGAAAPVEATAGTLINLLGLIPGS